MSFDSPTRRAGSATWSLEVPSHWTVKADEPCVTFADPQSGGVLQVSSAWKETPVEERDLLDFAAKHLKAGLEPSTCGFGEYAGFELELPPGEFAVNEWYLRQRRQALFVTFVRARGTVPSQDSFQSSLLNTSVDSSPADRNLALVRQLLGSLRQEADGFDG